ncbi:MAG: hypothetical protein AAGE80_16865 [Pseudomonadota bacterium]
MPIPENLSAEEPSVFERAKERASGGLPVANAASISDRDAISITRETKNPEAVADLAPLDGLTLNGLKPDLAVELVRAARPRCLWLYDMRLDSLDLLNTVEGLEALCLQDLTRVTDLAPVARHTGLSILSIRGLAKLTDIGAVAALEDLTALEIAPGSPVARQITLDLGPVRGLKRLTTLLIGGVRTPDQSTAVLDDLPALTDLDIGGNWPVEELARLAARYPHIETRWLKPLSANAHYPQQFGNWTLYDIDPAEHADAEITYTATGLRKPYRLDPEADAAKIATLRQEWEAHVARFKAEYGT